MLRKQDPEWAGKMRSYEQRLEGMQAMDMPQLVLRANSIAEMLAELGTLEQRARQSYGLILNKFAMDRKGGLAALEGVLTDKMQVCLSCAPSCSAWLLTCYALAKLTLYRLRHSADDTPCWICVLYLAWPPVAIPSHCQTFADDITLWQASGVVQAIQFEVAAMQEYCGFCMVFVHLRDAWYTGSREAVPLYCHSVSKQRLTTPQHDKQSVYDKLHALLTCVSQQAVSAGDGHHTLAAAVARAICAALKEVLLHGGALRVFSVADARLIEQDIQMLEVRAWLSVAHCSSCRLHTVSCTLRTTVHAAPLHGVSSLRVKWSCEPLHRRSQAGGLRSKQFDHPNPSSAQVHASAAESRC